MSGDVLIGFAGRTHIVPDRSDKNPNDHYRPTKPLAVPDPLGASGARIMTTLVNALEQRGGRWGLHTMCEGGGMANATIIERLD